MINVAVIGLGPWGQVIARKLNDLSPFSAHSVYDHKTIDVSLGRFQFVNSFDEILNNPSIQACIVTTPADTHADLAKMVIEAGKHVLVAKPLAIHFADCLDLIARAEDRNVVLMTGHTTLFNPAIHRLKTLIDNQDIYHIECERCGVGRVQNNNVLYDLAVHDLANLIFLTNSRIKASHHKYFGYGACKNAMAHMVMELEGGVTATIKSSWTSASSSRFTRIYCDGMIVVLDEVQLVLQVYKTTPGARVYSDRFSAELVETISVQRHDMLADELQFFAKSILENRPPAENQRVAAAVIEAIENSTEI
jgi:predicted dehydrogenase